MTDFQSAFNKKLHQRTFRRTPHYLIPGLNLQRVLCSDHCNEPGTEYSLHCVEQKLFIPKTKTPRLVTEGRDAATYLVGEKLRWQERASNLATRYRKSAKDRTSLELLHGKVLAGFTDITVSQSLAQFMKHMNNDPDPDFFGAYNWYYTEGTLQVVRLKKKAFVISVQGRYLDKICSVPLEENGGEWKPCISSLVTKSGPIRQKPIHQIKAREVKGRAVVGVRQRNAVGVYLNNVQRLDLNLVQLHTYEICENEKPLSGLDLDTSKLGHFCNSHSNRTIKVWDPARRTPVLGGRAIRNINCHKDSASSWCGVWYDKDDINQVAVADSCCVTWHDVRCGLNRVDGICLTSSMQGLPLEMSCEEVSLLVQSQQYHQLYLGTTHSLLQVDRRQPTQPVRRWTHMLNGQLLMGQTVPVLGTKSELICVSSTQQAVMVLGGEICCSQHPPLALPYTSVTQGMVGLSFLPHPHLKRNDIITQTGNCDIYTCCLKWDTAAVEKSNISDTNYCNQPSEVLQPVDTGRQLCITERCDMQTVYFGLQSAKKRPLCQEELTSSIQKQSWQRSKAELQSYIDVLAPGILDAWGIDDMQEWSTTVTVPSAADKVQQWLQMTSTSLNLIDDEMDVTSTEQVAVDRLQALDQTYCSDYELPTSQFLEDNAEICDPITTHSLSQNDTVNTLTVSKKFMQSDAAETVLSAQNNRISALNATGDVSFQLSPDPATLARPSKIGRLKRKSQVLGF